MYFSFVIGESPIAGECFAALGKIAANYFPLVFGLNMILQRFVEEENGAERTGLLKVVASVCPEDVAFELVGAVESFVAKLANP